jgi:translation elongation factor EF-4
VSILNNQKMLNALDVPLELVVIMTKSDITLSDSQEITHEQARKFCEEQSINKYFQCSSKQGNGNVCDKINKIVIAH